MIPLASAAFLVFGVVLVLVGSNQAALARALAIDLGASGLLAATLSLGLGIGVVAAGPLVDALPRRPLLVGAAALGAAALLSFGPQTDFAGTLGRLCVVGAAVGAYETLLNTVVAERFREGAARPLAGVHAAATLGAVLGPLWIATLSARGGWDASFRGTGLALAVVALWAALVELPPPARREAQARPYAGLARGIARLSVLAALYVGFETALTLFAVPWVRESLALPEPRGLRSISAFWMGLLGGRLLFLASSRGAVRPRLLVWMGAGAACAVSAGIALRLPPELTVGAAGVALGPVFPILVALASQRFPEARGTATGLVVGAGTLGGFAVPWLAGELGDRLGVEVAIGALAGCALAIAAVAWGFERGAPFLMKIARRE